MTTLCAGLLQLVRGVKKSSVTFSRLKFLRTSRPEVGPDPESLLRFSAFFVRTRIQILRFSFGPGFKN